MSSSTLVASVVAAPDAPPLDGGWIDLVRDRLEQAGGRVGAPVWLAPDRAADLPLDAIGIRAADEALKPLLAARRVDGAILPAMGRRKKLLVTDMESTVIQNELLDDLATLCGLGAKVAAITERAMKGEIDFTGALRERVALLAGQPASLLDRVRAGIREMPGARTLVRTMKKHGAYTALVSGGFKVFTADVRQRIGFDFDAANALVVENGHLSGRVADPILGADAKAETLTRLAAERGIALEDTLAVGDGANDLKMVARAGLGAGFRPKPILADVAGARVIFGDLTTLLFYQGYRETEFAS